MNLAAGVPRRWAVALLLSTVTLVIGPGCVRSDPPADLVIINVVEPGSLDPALAIGVEELRIVTALFEGLTRVDPVNAGPIPGLAERWERSPDGRTYTFFLRTNAQWSTGESITAEDVLYSWFRVLDQATASDYAGTLFYVKNAEAFYNGTLTNRDEVGIHKRNAHTVEVELINPTAYWLDLCALPVLAVVPRQAIERYGDRWSRARPLPVSGAYQLEAWRVNDKVRLRRNPRYWDAAHTHSELVDLLPIGNPSAVFNLYKAGEADLIWDKETVPAQLMSVLRTNRDCHTFNYLGTYFLRFNVTKKPFDQPKVRQALAMAIDKERIVNNLRKSGELTATHLVPPDTANYQPPRGLDYDPKQAQRLLKEAGYEGGAGFPPFEYLFDSSGGGASAIHGQIGVELQQMWQRELGIQVGLRQMEKKVFLKAQSDLQYEICRSSWIGDYNDANTFLDLFLSNGGNNRTGWRSPRYDELLRQANLETDKNRRADLLRQAETLLVRDELPIIPLFFYNGFTYYNPDRIRGVYTNILDLHPIGAIEKVRRGTKAQRRDGGAAAGGSRAGRRSSCIS